MPDRILTDADRLAIVQASLDPDRVLGGPEGHDGGPADVLLTTVEQIVADRTQALEAEVGRRIDQRCEREGHSEYGICEPCRDLARYLFAEVPAIDLHARRRALLDGEAS